MPLRRREELGELPTSRYRFADSEEGFLSRGGLLRFHGLAYASLNR